jgi:hypothetical protein
MSRKRDREKRRERAEWFRWNGRYCSHDPEQIIASGWVCPDIAAGKPECEEVPF